MNQAEDAWLASLAQRAGGRRLVVAFSGGMDSTCLVEALVRAGLQAQLHVVHVNHGLQPQSRDWACHCEAWLARKGLSGAVETLALMPGPNLEARARSARYRALARHLRDGDCLVLAHHLDDQAETLILRMMRGAAVHGLGAMREWQQRDGMLLWRPLLDQPRARLAQLAQAWQLDWVEDPSNQALHHDRNFIRHEVLPPLASRWPAVRRLGRTAQACQEAAELLDALACQDFEAMQARHQGEADTLSVVALLALPPSRRRNLLAWWVRQQGRPVPERQLLERLDPEVLQAAPDRAPQLVTPAGVWCRYRDHLYLLDPTELEPFQATARWDPAAQPQLTLGVVSVHGRPLADELTLRRPPGALEIRPAAGGERILQAGMHRQVSELWRQAGLPPWCRRRLPLFLVAGEVVAAPGIGVADHWQPVSGDAVLGIRVTHP